MACCGLSVRTGVMRWPCVALVVLVLVVLVVDCKKQQAGGRGDLLPRDLTAYGDSNPYVVSSGERRRANRNRPSGGRRSKGRKRLKDRHLVTNEEPMGQVRGAPQEEQEQKQRQEQLLLQQQQLQHLRADPDDGDDGADDVRVKSNFSPSFLRLTPSGNPLKDQPNLSKGRVRPQPQQQPQHQPQQHDDAVIHGSRRAFTITKLEYLKKEWCKTEPLKQVIREEGCRRRAVMNRFCYGQCNSFFIPKSNKRDLDSAAFRSCAFCKPRRTSTITVTLVCPNRRPRFRRKRIEMVKQCKCMAQRLN